MVRFKLSWRFLISSAIPLLPMAGCVAKIVIVVCAFKRTLQKLKVDDGVLSGDAILSMCRRIAWLAG